MKFVALFDDATDASLASPPMTSQERAFHEFAEFAAKLKGDEDRASARRCILQSVVAMFWVAV